MRVVRAISTQLVSVCLAGWLTDGVKSRTKQSVGMIARLRMSACGRCSDADVFVFYRGFASTHHRRQGTYVRACTHRLSRLNVDIHICTPTKHTRRLSTKHTPSKVYHRYTPHTTGTSQSSTIHKNGELAFQINYYD